MTKEYAEEVYFCLKDWNYLYTILLFSAFDLVKSAISYGLHLNIHMLNKDHNDLIKKQCKPGMFQIRFCDSKMNFFKHTILKWITAVLFPTYLHI